MPFAQMRHPNPARVDDWLCDGKDSYQLDRAFGRRLSEVDNTPVSAARINRDHGRLTVQLVAELGIEQVLDLGCGYPPWPAGHQPHTPLIREVLPQATILHVDIDAVVGTYAHVYRPADDDRCGVLQADIQYMAQVLAHPQVTHRFDPQRPLAVLLHDVLPWIGDDQTVDSALAALRNWLPPCSALSITHATADLEHAPGAKAKLTALWAEEAACAFQPRTREAIGALFGDWPLLDPGLVPTAHWHPDHPFAHTPQTHSGAYAGIALKPAAPTTEEPSCT
ncbi:SAM-dependent methyltransferase [Streptomyces sp. NPDC059070]|uniref:SAM-dependent methyltransferase n=1 Tax=Streptomyces sp. NPDC059070 TaxID=3346713 RepID=UPI00368BDF86